MAQLPTLSVSSQVPMSFVSFKELAARFLNENEVMVLNNLKLEPPRIHQATGSHFLDNWYKFERALRLALEQVRATKLKWESDLSSEEKMDIAVAVTPAQLAGTAVAIQNPLEAELFLDSARFKMADTIRGENAFSLDAVFSYGIKLLLCERAAKFNVELGRNEYSRVYNEIASE